MFTPIEETRVKNLPTRCEVSSRLMRTVFPLACSYPQCEESSHPAKTPGPIRQSIQMRLLGKNLVFEYLDSLTPQLGGSQVTSPLLNLQDVLAFKAIDHVVNRSAR